MRLSTRALNRALLARQGLLERWEISPEAAVERLVGLQAQAPQAHYAGLWARVAGLDPEALSARIAERRLVRIVLMRGTIFLVSAEDALRLRPLFSAPLERQLRGNRARRLDGLDLDAVAERVRALTADGPRTWAELGAALAEDFPESDADTLAAVARARVPLVQTPPRGLWQRSGLARHAPLEDWLGRPLAARPHETEAALEDALLRYLAAYGPATVRDVQTWSGLGRLRPVLERLRPRLRAFAGPAGEELLDVEDAPLPDPDTPAPVRLLPEYENLMFSFADRRRIVADEHRERVFTRGALLLDGFVAGAWKLDRRRRSAPQLRIETFSPVRGTDRRAVEAEAEALVAFLAPDAPGRTIILT